MEAERGSHEDRSAEWTLPEATVAGDWTFLGALAAVIAAVFVWRRGTGRSESS